MGVSKWTLLERDSLALLSYVASHREDHQTQRSLAEAVGCSQQRICYLIQSVKEYGMNGSVLAKTASKYGYVFRIINQPGHVLDVVYIGRIHQE